MNNSKPETRNSELILPALPDAATAAIVEHIYVAAGEAVRRGQALLLLRTERYAYDIPAAADGTLRELLVAAGDRIAPGQQFAVLDDDAAPEPAPAPPGRVLATPLARKIASERTVDLAQLQAEGMPRLLRRADVLRHADAATSKPYAAPLTLNRTTAPTLSALTAVELDWSAVDRYCARQAGRRRIDRRACLVSSVAGTLLRHHLVHAAWSEAGIVARRRVDIMIGDQLVRAAAELSAAGVARCLAEPSGAPDGALPFVILERAGALWSEAELHGAAAVLCIGQAATQPRVDGGDQIAARPVSLLALVYDLRVLDQPLADAFLIDLRSRMERMGSLC